MRYKRVRIAVAPIAMIAILLGLSTIPITFIFFPFSLIYDGIVGLIIWGTVILIERWVNGAALKECLKGDCPECGSSIDHVNGKYRCKHCQAVFAEHGKCVVSGKVK